MIIKKGLDVLGGLPPYPAVKRGTGCRANGDERQAIGTFTSQLVRYACLASEGHEQKLIDLGHPNAFVRNPTPSKRERDEIQSVHPKVLLCTMPMASGMTQEDRDAVCKLLTDICCTGLKSDQLYLKIQKFHAAKLVTLLVDHLESGGKLKDFKCRICKTLLNTMVMLSNKLMYNVDSNGTRKLAAVHKGLVPYMHEYKVFMDQHRQKLGDSG